MPKKSTPKKSTRKPAGSTTLKRLAVKNRSLKLELQNKKIERASRRLDVRAQYDAITGSENAVGGGNKRRQSRIETKEETGAQGILKPYSRLKGLNLCRDAARNFSAARSILGQIEINVIGPSPKCQINTGDDFGAEATKWANKRWMKACDFRSDRRFAKLGQLVASTKEREGDLLVVFDQDLRNSGKLIFFEADQICDLTNFAEWTAENGRSGWTQQDGVIYDEFGREVGYVTTRKRGQTSVRLQDAHVWPRDPEDDSKNFARMIRSDFRLMQSRGVAKMLAVVGDLLDCYEMRSKELQSAKVAASLAGTVKRKEAIEDFDDDRMDPDNENPTDDILDPTTLPEKQTEPANYERFESLTGGIFEYISDDDEIKLHDINRPNVEMEEFLDFVIDGAGSAFGLAHAYTRLRADKSYTAFRGDMVLSWVTFFALQKDMENEFLDWTTIRAIRWAMAKGLIKAKPPADWEDEISWTLPRMPFVDESKERDAHAKGVKNGELTYSELLGPDWEKRFKQLSEELNKARELLLPLDVFEQKSGGAAVVQNPEPKPDGDDDA